MTGDEVGCSRTSTRLEHSKSGSCTTVGGKMSEVLDAILMACVVRLGQGCLLSLFRSLTLIFFFDFISGFWWICVCALGMCQYFQYLVNTWLITHYRHKFFTLPCVQFRLKLCAWASFFSFFLLFFLFFFIHSSSVSSLSWSGFWWIWRKSWKAQCEPGCDTSLSQVSTQDTHSHLEVI